MIHKWPEDALDFDKSVTKPGQSSGWIQWKGTDVCMDIHCQCGHHGHIDAEFAYFYRCSNCQKVFAVGQTVRLYECTPEVAAKHGDRAVTEAK